MTALEHATSIAKSLERIGFTDVKVTPAPIPDFIIEQIRKVQEFATVPLDELCTGLSYMRAETDLGAFGMLFRVSQDLYGSTVEFDLTGTGLTARDFFPDLIGETADPLVLADYEGAFEELRGHLVRKRFVASA